jgi:hypothetical protein
MKKKDMMRVAARTAVAGVAIGAAGYAVLATSAWVRFGRAQRVRSPEREDVLLDSFVPTYDIVERHQIAVDAPASVTIACARDMDFADACLSRALFKAREMVLRAQPTPEPKGGLLHVMQSIGWGVLADRPGQEVVLGAVTRPWEPNPVFRSLPPGDFAGFKEPGFVKIAFTLRADSTGERTSLFRTETRAVATDAAARRLFRRYWSMVSPGVVLIRLAMLKPIKAAAETCAQHSV